MADFNISIAKTLAWEGGYVNNPKDPGGETKYGIAKAFHPKEDIKNLTVSRAKSIYKNEYWNAIKGDLIKDQAAADSIFDLAVIDGPSRAIAFANRAAKAQGLKSYLHLPGTKSSSSFFTSLFGKMRVAMHKAKVKAKPSQAVFLKGWVKRAKSFFK